MKTYLKTLAYTSCLTAALLGSAGTSQATLVTVDSSISIGRMDVFGLDEFNEPNFNDYLFGSAWGLADVKSTVGASSIVLEANYNTYANNPGNAYWRNNAGAGPAGNKWMVATTLKDVPATVFPDDLCNFQAELTDYTFDSGYTVRAFITGFNADYTTQFKLTSQPLNAGSVVDLEFDTSGWVRIQYGFEVQGINANPDFPAGSATVVANVVPPIVYGIPNAGFEIPDGAQWDFDQANGHTVDYQPAGGNPGGYAEINGLAATQTWYAVLVANSGLQIPLEALSLTPGQTHTFAMDMKLVEGNKIGGLKVEFLPGTASTGEMYPTGLTGDGSEWATYSFPVTIPANAAAIKIVPLWGSNSRVQYDNIRVAGPFAASAETVASDLKISWPTVTGRSYQVKKSIDLLNWAPFGSVVNGNGATFSVTDPVASPGKAFFQVLETTP